MEIWIALVTFTRPAHLCSYVSSIYTVVAKTSEDLIAELLEEHCIKEHILTVECEFLYPQPKKDAETLLKEKIAEMIKSGHTEASIDIYSDLHIEFEIKTL